MAFGLAVPPAHPLLRPWRVPWRPSTTSHFVREGGKTVKHRQRTDLNEPPVGTVMVRNDWMEVLFEIPVWRQDQLESLKRAFVECVFLRKTVWLWTSSFAIYVPIGQASTRRGCNTEFVMDNDMLGAMLIIWFDVGFNMPKQITVRPDSWPTWPPAHRIVEGPGGLIGRCTGSAPADEKQQGPTPKRARVAKRPAAVEALGAAINVDDGEE